MSSEGRPGDEDLVEDTHKELDRAEDADDATRLETLEKVREELESELEERDDAPPA